ncbi:hypothetical protein ACTZHC_10760 [Escherichia coli]|uniref:hypothetical protein n=1 Tax=Escherichia coli TaxID=562 RepID=UPI0005116141|nr:hypothetical protein [Escherichia coli]MCS1315906.1 hypothetical protein [Escherichia coli]STL44053.1 Uncharacterised protein [Escherichia coli]
MSYSDIVATIAMIVSITAVPASGYLSYRYAIEGEKRKEWNGVVEPILEYLEGHELFLSKKKCPDYTFHSFPSKNWDAAIRRSKDPKKYQQALQDYRSVLNEIKTSPAPVIYFGQSESEREEWIDRYPDGINRLNELMTILALK